MPVSSTTTGVGIGRRDGIDDGVLAPGQRHIGVVKAFTLDANPERYDEIGTLSQEGRLRRRLPGVVLELCLRQQLLQLRKRRRRQEKEAAPAPHDARTADIDDRGVAAGGQHRARAGACRHAQVRIAADHRDL